MSPTVDLTDAPHAPSPLPPGTPPPPTVPPEPGPRCRRPPPFRTPVLDSSTKGGMAPSAPRSCTRGLPHSVAGPSTHPTPPRPQGDDPAPHPAGAGWPVICTQRPTYDPAPL